jgi:inner membrane protein
MDTSKLSQSLTLKAFIVAVLTLFSFIPNAMIMMLIHERENRSLETIQKINEKWSLDQTIGGPILTIPYVTYSSDDQKKTVQMHELHLTPENMKMQVRLFPEERHYGIYKTILYKSEISITGNFALIKNLPENVDFDRIYLSLGISDLRGVTNRLNFTVNNKEYATEAGTGSIQNLKKLIAPIKGTINKSTETPITFECQLNLNGSRSISFIPIGSTSRVEVEGDWKAPGFIGNFSPDYTLTDAGFKASWNVLSFNRSIPESWIDRDFVNFNDTSFGVNLVDTVNHYQQNMRSAKYSIMFIVLTFVVFFFVEVLSKKRIHPIQYLLVGVALILFYSLLLSLSEQISFGAAYIIATLATIALIVGYSSGIFKSKTETIILTLILSLLYTFLYVILQLEDIALLIGSIGLFVILGIIMYLSRKIKWYKSEELIVKEE